MFRSQGLSMFRNQRVTRKGDGEGTASGVKENLRESISWKPSEESVT